MVNEKEIKPTTMVGQVILNRMKELGLSIRDVAVKTDTSYEHVRKVTRGETLPARFVMREICRVLDLDLDEVEKTAMADRLRHKYGPALAEMIKRASARPLDQVWTELSPEQQNEVIAVASNLAKRNKQSKVMTAR